MKLFLLVTAIFEGLTGLGLLLMPAFTISMLLGVGIVEPAGLVGGRIAGAALLALAIACWQGQNGEQGSPATGVVAAMLFYNIAATVVLVYAGIGLGMQSAILWSAIVIHLVLLVWNLLVLLPDIKRLQQN